MSISFRSPTTSWLARLSWTTEEEEGEKEEDGENNDEAGEMGDVEAAGVDVENDADVVDIKQSCLVSSNSRNSFSLKYDKIE